MIAIDQDSLGIQALKYASRDSVDVWVKALAHGDWAVCFLNRDVAAKDIKYNWRDHQVIDDVANRQVDFSKQVFDIRDLWASKNVGATAEPFSAQLPGHDVIILRLSPKN